MTLSELLKRKRIDYGYRTISEMAKDMDVNPVHLSRFMRGEPVRMDMKMRQAITRVLNVDPGVLSELVSRACLREYEMETLIAFRDHGMRRKETAEALYIHPATLSYRLRSIKDATGKDPKNWEQLCAMTRRRDA